MAVDLSMRLRWKMVLVCGILTVLGIASAASGFAAEATRVKVSEVRIVGYACVYPSNPALGLGTLAAVCAIITRIIILMVVGCCNCRSQGSTSSLTSCLFNILSWIASVVATILLLAGATMNSREGGQKYYHGTIMCYVVKPGIFAAGAVVSLLSAFFGIIAYVSATRTTSKLDFGLPIATVPELDKTQGHPQEG